METEGPEQAGSCIGKCSPRKITRVVFVDILTVDTGGRNEEPLQ